MFGGGEEANSLDFYFAPDQPGVLTADTISLFNELFEHSCQQAGKEVTMDLKMARGQLQRQQQNGELTRIPLEIFDHFFGDFMKKKTVITQQEFSDMVSNNEDALLGIGNKVMEQPAKMKLGQKQPEPEVDREENFFEQKRANKDKLELSGTEYAAAARDKSSIHTKTEQTSLVAFTISELSVHSEKPEVQLTDVMQTLIDSGAFEEFRPQDWVTFFEVFRRKFDHVSDKIAKFSDREQEFLTQQQDMQKEREQTQLEMNSLREENKAAFEENAVLQEMANEFNTFQRIFQETQQSETKLREYLTQAQNQLADTKAKLGNSKQNEKELTDALKDYQEQINDLKIELQSAKQIILEEGKSRQMLQRTESIRASIAVQRQSITQHSFASQALQGIRQSTVLASASSLQSKEEKALKAMDPGDEMKYMKQLQMTAKSSKLTDSERKGMLMIAQQFERYKKAYEACKREKETLEEEQEKILKGIEKLDKQAEDRKKQNVKDRKEIEKLKVKVEQLEQQREELVSQINRINVEMTMVNQGMLAKAGDQNQLPAADSQLSSQKATEPVEVKEELPDANDLPEAGDDIFAQFDKAQDNDFGNYIQNLRDSRVGSFVRPLRHDPGSYLSAEKRPLPMKLGQMQTFGKGASFRPTMLNKVQEDEEKDDEEEEDEEGFEVDDELDDNEENFEAVDAEIGDITEELHLAGNDEERRLEILLKHLEAKTITKGEMLFYLQQKKEGFEVEVASQGSAGVAVIEEEEEYRETNAPNGFRLQTNAGESGSEGNTSSDEEEQRHEIGCQVGALTYTQGSQTENDQEVLFRQKEQLAAYCNEMKGRLNDEKLLARLAPEDVEVFASAPIEGLQFIEKADFKTSAADYQAKLQEIEGKIVPIFWNIKLEDKEKLETYCSYVKKILDENRDRFSENDGKAIESCLKDGHRLMEKSIQSSNFDDFDKRYRKLEAVFNLVMATLREQDIKKLVEVCDQISRDLADEKFRSRFTEEGKQMLETSRQQGLAFIEGASEGLTFLDFQKKRQDIEAKVNSLFWNIKLEEKEKLETYCGMVTQALVQYGERVSKEDRASVESTVAAGKAVIEMSVASASVNDFIEHMKSCQLAFNTLATKLKAEDRQKLELFVNKIKNDLASHYQVCFSDEEKQMMTEAYTEGVLFLASVDASTTAEQFEAKHAEIENKVSPVYWSIKLEEKEKLEGNCALMEATMVDVKLKDRISDEERKSVDALRKDAVKLIETSLSSVSLDDFSLIQSRIDSTFAPVLLRLKTHDKRSLEDYCSKIKQSLDDEHLAARFTAEDRVNLQQAYEAGLKLVAVPIDQVSIEQYQQKLKETELKFAPIVSRIRQNDKLKLETFCNQIKAAVQDEKMKDRFTGDERKAIIAAHREGLQFVKKTDPGAEIDAYSHKLSDIQATYNPIAQRIKQQDKQRLDDYCQQIRSTLDDESLRSKFTADERKLIETAHKEALKFAERSIDNMQVEEVYRKLEEVDQAYAPIISRIKQQDKQKLADYCEQIASYITDEQLTGRFSAEDKKVFVNVHRVGTQFTAKSIQDAAIDDFSKKLEEMENKFNPIMNKIKQQDKLKLEQYCQSMMNTTNDLMMKNRITADDREVLANAIQDGLIYKEREIEQVQVEDFSRKQVEMERLVAPIMAKIKHEDKVKLEEFCNKIKNTLIDEKLKGKFTADDKVVLLSAHRDGLQLSLKSEEFTPLEDYSRMLKDVEGKFNPIITKIKRKEKQHLQEMAQQMKSAIETDKLTEGDRQLVQEAHKEAKQLLERDATIEEMSKKIKELEMKFAPISKKVNLKKRRDEDDEMSFDREEFNGYKEGSGSDSDDGGKFFAPNLAQRKSKQVSKREVKDDSDDDEEESRDVVRSMIKQERPQFETSSSMFDATLLDKAGDAQNKVQQILHRASMARANPDRRNTVIGQTSNKKEFDYLFLTKPSNDKHYQVIKKMLEAHQEGQVREVFSEYIQSFNPELKVTEYMILITPKSLFLLDKQARSQSKQSLSQLKQIIMIKSNPCIFALSFGSVSIPLLLQSIRRSELIMFLLTHCKDNNPKPNVARSNGIRVFLQDKQTKSQYSKVITFDKINIKMDNVLSKQLMEQIEKNVQLNNFVNAINSGYLKMRTSSFLKGTRWEEHFVVLTNVGLLYFADPLKPPLDLFPVLDCEIQKVPKEQVGGNESTFTLVYLTKHVTFQCSNSAEYNDWMLQIKVLQKQTYEARERLKQEEVRRMTMLLGKQL